jgi:hypothetical protein
MSWSLWICSNDAVGKFFHENLTIEKVDEILDLCREGQLL